VRKFFFLFFLAVFSSISVNQAAQTPEVIRETLDNGLRVIVVPNKLAPVVTTEINYLVGSNEAPAGFPGMAHALEHMMFRGNKELSAAQLSTITAGMGGQFNADTQQTVTQYFFTAPATYLSIALNVEANRMSNTFHEDELWTKERGAIDQEVARDLSSPEYVMYKQLLEAMFSGTPYAQDALGTRESFAKTTGSMLQKFHNEWYAPNNAILVIVGDVDPAKAIEETKKLFGPIPRRNLPTRPEIKLNPMKAKFIELDSDLPYGLSVVAYRLPGYNNPDYAAGQVLADILGSQRADIYGLVPAGKALGAEFSSASLPIASIGYAAAAFPPKGNGASLIAELKNIVANYVKNGVPPDLVEASKRHEVSEAEFEKNSIPGLAQSWSQAVAVENRKSPEEAVREIQKVSVADVNRVAREYLINDTAITAILTPKPSGKAVASKGFGGGESFAPSQVKPVQLPNWAKKVAEPPSTPASNLNPVDSRLTNGLRLIVQPEIISPTISVFGRIKTNSDLEAPEGQEGISEVLENLFTYGTKSLDRLAFRKAIDDIGANESAGAEFSLQVLKDHFERGVELLASNMLEPALPQSAFKIVQQETAGLVAGQLQSPRFLSQLALVNELYPKGDPTQRHATPESVLGLKYENVAAYYQKTFRPDLATIVVIGQIDSGVARQTIEKYFGKWKSIGPKPNTDLPPVPNNKPSATVVPDPSRVQDEVTLAQTLGFDRSNPEYYKIQLGNHVLSGAFYATRLYHNLREEAGLVYNVSSSIDAGKTRSTFSVTYACDPPNVGKARGLIERDLKQMQSAPITPEELQNARTLLVMNIPLSESSMSKIAAQILRLAELDLPLNEPVLAAKKYMEITAPQIQESFAKWLRPADFVQVTLGPNPK
jgi:zinc protease